MVEFFGVFGAIASLCAALLAFRDVRRVKGAERKLLVKLKGDREVERVLHEMRTLNSLTLSTETLSTEHSRTLMEAILRHMMEMQPDEQRGLKEVLEQPSAIGRQKYVAKLAESLRPEKAPVEEFAH